MLLVAGEIPEAVVALKMTASNFLRILGSQVPMLAQLRGVELLLALSFITPPSVTCLQNVYCPRHGLHLLSGLHRWNRPRLCSCHGEQANRKPLSRRFTSMLQ